MKKRGEKIAMITAYDYTAARLVEEAGMPIILVGDSLGNVMLGYDSTVPVTMDEMVHHIKAVVRGTERAHIVGDLPFLSYQADVAEALRNAGRLLKEGGCQSVKLEGGRYMADTVYKMVQSGIPVMGHIGLTPQAVNQLGGYRVQGRTPKAAVEMMEELKVGALTVLDENARLAGIISEHDCARKIILTEKSARETTVADIMTTDVVTVGVKSSADKCMSLMSQKTIRHLPVMDGQNLAGIIAVGDLLKFIIRKQEMAIEELESYIMDETGGSG